MMANSGQSVVLWDKSAFLPICLEPKLLGFFFIGEKLQPLIYNKLILLTQLTLQKKAVCNQYFIAIYQTLSQKNCNCFGLLFSCSQIKPI